MKWKTRGKVKRIKSEGIYLSNLNNWINCFVLFLKLTNETPVQAHFLNNFNFCTISTVTSFPFSYPISLSFPIYSLVHYLILAWCLHTWAPDVILHSSPQTSYLNLSVVIYWILDYQCFGFFIIKKPDDPELCLPAWHLIKPLSVNGQILNLPFYWYDSEVALVMLFISEPHYLRAGFPFLYRRNNLTSFAPPPISLFTLLSY